MRFEVPQFIEIEDKIFGPFTWRQFIYLAGGVGMGVVTFIAMPIFFFVIIGLPLSGLGFLLAFYPVNNRPFSDFLESVFHFYNSSRVYHWRKKSDVVYRGETGSFAPSAAAMPPVDKRTSTAAGSINQLSRKLELNAIQKDI